MRASTPAKPKPTKAALPLRSTACPSTAKMPPPTMPPVAIPTASKRRSLPSAMKGMVRAEERGGN